MQGANVDIVRTAALILGTKLMPGVGHEKLPWRENPTPYRIFIAEFMLIRTRTDVVARIFEEFCLHYPDIRSLAQADQDELARLLWPLGLPQRIPFMIRAANFIIERGGEIPNTQKELEIVPGLGPYTAGAISAFAFGSTIVPADVNVLRFLSRITGLPMEHKTKGSKELRNYLSYLSSENGGPGFSVLLDFTRSICKPRFPNCPKCPLNEICRYSGGLIPIERNVSNE